MANDCIFCKIARKEIPASIVAETHEAVAFRDINAQAPVHVLVIPRAHATSLNDVTDATVLGNLISLAKDVAGREQIAESGYRVVINTGGDGGQAVSHLHVHVLGGRRLGWPPG